MNYLGCVLLAVFATAWLHSGESTSHQGTSPFGNGVELVSEYARRTGVEPVKTISLGNGVTMDLVLIPAGNFIMGRPVRVPVDEAGFREAIGICQAVLALGCSLLAVLLTTVFTQAIRRRHWPQYSLQRLLGMTFMTGIAVWGGVGWWDAARRRDQARNKYALLDRKEGMVEKVSWEDQFPMREVRIASAFYLGKYEVTREQYLTVIGGNAYIPEGHCFPVTGVSWYDAQDFCKRVRLRTGFGLRLPSESEWEYACRAGSKTDYFSGNGQEALAVVGWYEGNSVGTIHKVDQQHASIFAIQKDDLFFACDGFLHEVGQKPANCFGLHDMHGNVREWCEDDYNPNYNLAPCDGTAWINVPRTECRVLRGGFFAALALGCTSGFRAHGPPFDQDCSCGFRVALDAVPTSKAGKIVDGQSQP